MSLRNIIERQDFKVVSFDIFDTLVYRPLCEPEDMFTLMQQEVELITGKKVAFREIRTGADSSARAVLKHGCDVTLDDIYYEIGKVLQLDPQIVNKIKELELSYEKRLLTKRYSVVQQMEYAFSIGKRIILTSDMYLPKWEIEVLLKNIGINTFHAIYVSSDIGLRKDSLTMFPYILEKEGIKPAELLHVGDNEYSDIQVPQDMGIQVFHIKRTRDLFFETSLAKTVYMPRLKNLSLYSRVAFAMGINKCFDDPFDEKNSVTNGDLQLFGYFYMGPLLLSFTKWVAETAEKQNINKLFFLSRDGEILYKLYQILAKNSPGKFPQADYIEISRQSVTPFIKGNNDIIKVLSAPYAGDALENFFNTRFGIDITYLDNKKLNEFGFEDLSSKVYMPQDFEKIKALAEYVFQTNKKVFDTKRKTAIKYLKYKKLFDDSNKAVVDIGYSGTMQKFLNEVIGKPIHGLYMVTNNTIQTNIGKPGIFTKGLFGDNIDPHADNVAIERNNVYYEMILSSVKGSVKEYKLQLGKPRPVYENVAWEEREKIKKLPLIHQGILNFCEDFLSTFNNIDFIPYEDLDFLQEPFIHFLQHPTLEDVIMLSGYSFDDYYCGNRIFYWVPTPAELENKNFTPGKFIWGQALNIINAEEKNKIKEVLHLQNLRFGHLFNQKQNSETHGLKNFYQHQNEFQKTHIANIMAD